MREFKGDWKDLFNGFVLALDFRKMFLGFLGILFTVLVCGTITYIYANNLKAEGTVELPANLTFHEFTGSLLGAWHQIYSGDPEDPTPWGWGVFYTVLIVPTFLLVWGLFGGAIARIAAYEIARDGERIETAKALRFSWSKFSSFFMAPMICVLGFLFFFLCNVIGGMLTKGLDLLLIGGPIGAILLPLALLSGFIMILIAIGSMVGAPLFFPAVAAEGTDSFDAMSRGFSYVYSRPWHFAWYQFVAAAYGWVCIAFVLVFTVLLCFLGVRAAGTGFDWAARLRTENVYGMSLRDGKEVAKEQKLYDILKINETEPTGTDKKEWAEYEENMRLLDQALDENLSNDENLSSYAKRVLLDPNSRKLQLIGRHIERLRELDPDTARVFDSGKAGARKGDSRLNMVNDKAWDLLLSRRHVDTDLYEWSPRAIFTEPHPYGRTMFILNCSITWDLGHEDAEVRTVGIDRSIAGMSKDDLAWGWEMKLTYWIVTAWLILAMGLAYGYAVSYFISQQTVIYFLLRKKVDGIEMNEVFEEPGEEEPLPEISKPSEPPPKETGEGGKKKKGKKKT